MIATLITMALILLGLWGVIQPAVGNKRFRWIFRRRAFGEARWARPKDVRRLRMLEPGGLFLGQWRGFFGLARRDFFHVGEGHLITIAGAGGGKSSGLVVPTLCALTEGSVVVTDPSGELAAMTARRREEVGPVIFLNPFRGIFSADTGLDYPDHGFNPFAMLDPEADTFISDVSAFARLLMVTDRRESGSYWNDEGTEFLALMIASIRLYDAPDLHHLPFLYSVVRDTPEGITARCEWIHEQGHPALMDEAVRFASIIKDAPPQWQGIASKAALATKRYAPSTPLGEHSKCDGFDPARLKAERVTVFLLVPPSMLPVALPWLNMLVGVFGMAVGKPGPRFPVTMLIDEAPALGFLPDLRAHMAQFRKVGLRVWLFSQTYSALAGPDLYGEAGMKEIMGLTAVKQFFAVEEPEVQRMVSDLCGQRTVENMSSTGTVGDVGQPLFRPDQVRGLRPWTQVIIRGGVRFPIFAHLIPYFDHAEWRHMVDANPYRSG